MKTHSIFTSLIFLLVLSPQIVSSADAEEKSSEPGKEDGFVPLFNGKNFDGWYLKLKKNDDQLANKVFSIDENMVHIFKDFPDEYELGGENHTHGLMFTKRKYSRYIFRFDYKWGKKVANNFKMWQYDAGCYFHVNDDRIWPDGLEYQVRYDHLSKTNHTGDFVGPGVMKMTWYTDNGKNFQLPDKGGVAKTKNQGQLFALPSADYHGLDDEWNHCEIIVMGSEYVIFKLNGKIVNMATELGTSEGMIGLQSETAEIYYRNIEIKEFEQTIPIDHFSK